MIAGNTIAALEMDSPDRRRSTVKRLVAARAVAVIRLKDPERLLPLVEALLQGGLRGVEITLTVPNAIEQIATVDDAFGRDVLLGVGSVLKPAQVESAVRAGAAYVVSPVFKESLVREAHRLGAASLPGAFTPTEVQTAHEAGADIVKVFPADVLGMPFFKGVLAPMPHLRLMPTGGVTLDNAGAWLKAGACAVGVGSALLDKEAIARADWARITDHAKRLMASVQEAV